MSTGEKSVQAYSDLGKTSYSTAEYSTWSFNVLLFKCWFLQVSSSDSSFRSAFYSSVRADVIFEYEYEKDRKNTFQF